MNKYTISLTGTILFGFTTVVLFLLSWTGNLYVLTGSVAIGVIIYFGNVTSFLSFLIFYIWQKAKRRSMSVGTYETLSAYANTQRDASVDIKIPKEVRCSIEELRRVINADGEQIITLESNAESLDAGEVIVLLADNYPKQTVRAKVIALEGATLRLFIY